MSLRFTLIDPVAGTSTIIDEPIGMDKVSLHIRRDGTYHGFLDAIDDSLGAFQFYGVAYTLLRSAYQTYGVDADMRLLIEYACADSSSYDTLYQGRFSFDQYKEIRSSSGCYIECSIINGYNLQAFRSRMGQKVSLDSLRTFDPPHDPLTAYDQLGRNIMLNPKMVRFLDYATIDTTGQGSKTYYAAKRDSSGATIPNINGTATKILPLKPAFVSPDDNSTDTANNEFLLGYGGEDYCVSPFTNIRSAEFGDFPGCVGDLVNHQVQDLDDWNKIFHYTPDIPFDKNDISIDIDISGALFFSNQTQTDCRVAFCKCVSA
jgi:hypothetical protein